MQSPGSTKICTLEQVVALRRQAAARGERVVQCHGCFDIVHPGHVRHLQHARELGERLLVSITADRFIDKGIDRPLFEQTLRAENLAALACVDWVLVNPAPTATELLSVVRPDIYVKGAEYERNDDPRFAQERNAVERHGGSVVFSSGDIVFSSSALIDSMRLGLPEDDPFAPSPGATSLRRLHETHDLSGRRIDGILEDIRGRRVLIVGESIIDTYVDCAWPDVTGEAPVMSLRPRSRVSFDGGAAVIARHAAAAGARPLLLTPLPDTHESRDLVGRLSSLGIDVEPIPTEAPIPRKERFLVGRDKLVKLDHAASIELDHVTRTRLVDIAASEAIHADAAIIADYGLGMLAPRTTAELFSALRPRVGTLAGDISGARPSLVNMLDADWITPSERELRAALTQVVGSLPAVACELMTHTRARHLAVTMAADGLVVFSHRPHAEAHDGQANRLYGQHVPALNRAPLDTLGCGDALLALGSLALASGADVGTCAYIGSIAAAACAARLGNHAGSPADISHHAHRLHNARRASETQRAPIAI